MSNELFIRTYPASGARPATYSAGFKPYYLCLVFGFFFLVFLGLAVLSQGNPIALAGAVGNIVAILAALARAHGFRLEIKPDGISYTTWMGEAQVIAFPEISAVVIEDRGRNPYTGKPKRQTLVITPNTSTGRPPLRIELSNFPESARADIEKLLQPQPF